MQIEAYKNIILLLIAFITAYTTIYYLKIKFEESVLNSPWKYSQKNECLYRTTHKYVANDLQLLAK